MFQPRKIEGNPGWLDPDGIKVYTLSARNLPVDQSPYLARLAEVKKQKAVPWAATPAFAIFHDGLSMAYLVLAWWGNDNELFTSVSVQTASGWAEDPARYSFCVYDLEVIWQERRFFVDFVYRAAPDLAAYRAARFVPRLSADPAR